MAPYIEPHEVQLVPMPQLAEVSRNMSSKGEAAVVDSKKAKDIGDDWTGIKDVKLRKKLQNRLNVRAHRK